jgi:steroid delta-isomerase-like uncharacterized protein
MGSQACTNFFNFTVIIYLMSNTDVVNAVNPSQEGEGEEENMAVVRQFFEAARTGDTSKAYEIIGPHWANSESQANPRLRNLHGPEAFIEAIKMLHTTFADLGYKEEEIFALRDRVVAIMSVSGRHVGDYGGIPATERSFSTSAVEIFKIANGKIVENRSFRDRLRFLIQVGVLGPASPKYEDIFQALKNSIR